MTESSKISTKSMVVVSFVAGGGENCAIVFSMCNFLTVASA